MSKYKIILLTSYPNLLSFEALSGNMIYKMKVCLNIDDVFKLFEIVILADFHDNINRNTKRSCYIFIIFCFRRKKPWHNVCHDSFYHIMQYYGIHPKQIERIAAFICFIKFFALIFYSFLF